ncbi:Hypothetical protein ORPV_804 [Orpheovirus IHUMI-LCC2]|uniref:LPG0439 HIT-related domain-containing protein n=1 Tax=Orpheovirus IHUMI-LCC2 TaxID=2023057 RepID=A0A2I2L586_9VIRU|nr:Hypothetical protein ORPV_804 [Orpheovirus IHUMI-LCC2]SNW62708.1 Hypothetical protein ORPV_804 [Orpheovirus IHUMI-LCC2]
MSNIIYTNAKSHSAGFWDNNIENHECLLHLNKSKTVNVGVYLNPTDNRCYRMVVLAQGAEDVRGLLNKSYEDLYKQGVYEKLFKVASEFMCFLSSKGLIVQLEMAGNNSQKEENGMVTVGTKEPNFPHLHIICRQAENFELYGVKYMGPKMGELFNMRDGKQRYSPEVLSKLVKDLKEDYKTWSNL